LEYVGWVEEILELNYGVLTQLSCCAIRWKQTTLGIMELWSEMSMTSHF
jgi:hypothetical protein